jgi:hypothetical protein
LVEDLEDDMPPCPIVNLEAEDGDVVGPQDGAGPGDQSVKSIKIPDHELSHIAPDGNHSYALPNEPMFDESSIGLADAENHSDEDADESQPLAN